MASCFQQLCPHRMPHASHNGTRRRHQANFFAREHDAFQWRGVQWRHCLGPGGVRERRAADSTRASRRGYPPTKASGHPCPSNKLQQRLSRGIHKMHVNSGRGSTKPCKTSDYVPTVPTSEACCETCCAALSLITLHWSIQPLLAASKPSTNVCSSHEKTPPPGRASLCSGKTKPRKGSRHQTHALLLVFRTAQCGF
jgi:hypothetical protein